MPGYAADVNFGPPALPADGARRGWILPPYPAPEVPRARRDYAVDILAHVTDRAIMMAACQVVHTIARRVMTQDQIRLLAWNHVRATSAAQQFPFLALGWLGDGAVQPGGTSSAVVMNGFTDAVLRSVREDFGMDWTHPELYFGNRHYVGLLFRPPVSGRTGPWSRLAPPPPPSDLTCNCPACERLRSMAGRDPARGPD